MAGTERVTIDGKQFAQGGERFSFRGVTYGTFSPREDGVLFPERDRIKLDFAAMRDAGFTVVRTYTAPSDDLMEIASDVGLHVFAGVFFPDWRYVVGSSRRQARRVAKQACSEVAHVARRLRGNDRVLALCLGNEVPADVIRWFGTDVVADTISRLADVVRDIDHEVLVTYANYPTAEYLPLDSLDFLTFNVFLEERQEARRYLTRLHHIAGDRPLVLGEIGLDAGDGSPEAEVRQAEVIDWQLETALERGVAGTCVFSWTDEWAVGGTPVEDWHFGLTRADRTPRPALTAAAAWNGKTVRDLDFPWPSITVVICAYNAEATLDECLRHTCALDYPNLEVIVVDDGSTDATAEIARRYPRCRLVQQEHAGLSVARNQGFQAATGELIAYLDSDAYPTPEWPYYLALAFDRRMVGGAGGPNVPPPDDEIGAHQVARAPGGPVHVLISDDRAEHVPGCNMAFWRKSLTEVGGFDPTYTAAGDDVDICWKVLDRGLDIGFHPAALVWHHRRPGLRPYLKQQRGYGRAEALVEARHPDRFTPTGTARWRGHIYNSSAPATPLRSSRQRIYRGPYGTAPFQSIYRGGDHLRDLVHQVGVPLAGLVLLTAPFGLLHIALAVPAAVALAFLLVLLAVDTAATQPPRGLTRSRLRFRLAVAAMHILQPLARWWGRVQHRSLARRDLPPPDPLPGPVSEGRRGVLLLPHVDGRYRLATQLIAFLNLAGLRTVPSTGWEDHDAQIIGSPFVYGELVTSSFPLGYVQLRVRRRLRWGGLGAAAVAIAAAVYFVDHVTPIPAFLLATAVVGTAARGIWMLGPRLRRVLASAATPAEEP